MIKIAKYGCFDIQYNDKYIAASGNKIVIYKRRSLEEFRTYDSIRNISHLGIDDQFVYARNTSGSYFVFDYIKNVRICRSKHKKLYNGNCDNQFSISPQEHCLIDVLQLKDEFYYLAKFFPETNSYTFVKLLRSPYFVLASMQYDDDNKKAHVLFTETCCLSKKKTQSWVFTVNTISMQVEEQLCNEYLHGVWPIGIVNGYKILSNDMTILDFKTKQQEKTIGLTKDQLEQNGFLRKLIVQKYDIIFICGNSIFVYNQQSKLVENMFEKDHCSAACIIDNNIWIGSWDGIYINQLI